MTTMFTFLIFVFLSFTHLCTSTVYTCNRQSSCGCSLQATVTLSRIIGGESVQIPHTWGWMGSLRRNNIHQCGASLLSPYFAITAAHCLQDLQSISQLSLNFGTNNLSAIGDLHEIRRVITHPLFNRTSFTNDIAILVLRRSVDTSRFKITPICLPTQYNLDDTISEFPPAGQSLVALGWGTTIPFRRMTATMLQQVTLEAIGNDEQICIDAINDNVVQFCAGSRDGTKDTCAGDSGGPLMMFNDGRWYLMGITSYGRSCADPNQPGIYTRVSYYDSFIRSVINSQELFPKDTNEFARFEQNRSRAAGMTRRQMSTWIIFLFVFCLHFIFK